MSYSRTARRRRRMRSRSSFAGRRRAPVQPITHPPRFSRTGSSAVTKPPPSRVDPPHLLPGAGRCGAGAASFPSSPGGRGRGRLEPPVEEFQELFRRPQPEVRCGGAKGEPDEHGEAVTGERRESVLVRAVVPEIGDRGAARQLLEELFDDRALVVAARPDFHSALEFEHLESCVRRSRSETFDRPPPEPVGVFGVLVSPMDCHAKGFPLERALAGLARDPLFQAHEGTEVLPRQLPAPLAPAAAQTLATVAAPDLGSGREVEQPLERFRRAAADEHEDGSPSGLDLGERLAHPRVRESGLPPFAERSERAVVVKHERSRGRLRQASEKPLQVEVRSKEPHAPAIYFTTPAVESRSKEQRRRTAEPRGSTLLPEEQRYRQRGYQETTRRMKVTIRRREVQRPCKLPEWIPRGVCPEGTLRLETCSG